MRGVISREENLPALTTDLPALRAVCVVQNSSFIYLGSLLKSGLDKRLLILDRPCVSYFHSETLDKIVPHRAKKTNASNTCTWNVVDRLVVPTRVSGNGVENSESTKARSSRGLGTPLSRRPLQGYGGRPSRHRHTNNRRFGEDPPDRRPRRVRISLGLPPCHAPSFTTAA